MLWLLCWNITSHRSKQPEIGNVQDDGNYSILSRRVVKVCWLQSKFLWTAKLWKWYREQFVVDLVYTFRFLNHIHKVYKSAHSNIWLRSPFIIAPFSMWSFSSRLFIKETIDVGLLAWDAAQGTDPFDLVIEAIWFGCTKLLDPEQFSCPAKWSEQGWIFRTVVNFLKDLHSHVIHRMIWLMEVSVE